jgi:hypothetical protein
MKFSDVVIFHEKIAAELGDDLVVSLAYDDGDYFLAISVHKSKQWKFHHGRNIQSCVLTEKDMEKDLDVLVHAVVELYRNELTERNYEIETA